MEAPFTISLPMLESCSTQVSIDIYGNGPDLPAIKAEAERRGLPLQFRGQADHCSKELQEYKVQTGFTLRLVIKAPARAF